MKTYKVGIIGFAHMHVFGFIKDFEQTAKERIQWVGGCDVHSEMPVPTEHRATREANIKTCVDCIGAFPIFETVDEVLALAPDLLIVCTENNHHGDVCAKALLRGIHVLVEKPMAFTMEQAYAMVRASELGGARLFINWPSTWMPAIRTAHRLVQEGAIGKPFRFHYRNYASLGPFSYGQNLTPLQKSVQWWHREATGGGAMMDYCCYGACLARWILGEDPVSAYGLRANFGHAFADADDYGTITAQYPSAVAIVEGSWTTLHPGVTNGPIIAGDQGTLVTNVDSVHLFTKYHSDEPPTIIAADPLPAGRENAALEVLHALDTGEAIHPTMDLPVNLGAMMMLDAALTSSRTGKQEMAKTRTYTIGM